MKAWRVHRGWVTRAALPLVATGLIEAAVGGLAARPFPWVVLIPATLPLSLMVFVAFPALKEAERES